MSVCFLDLTSVLKSFWCHNIYAICHHDTMSNVKLCIKMDKISTNINFFLFQKKKIFIDF